MRVDTISTLLRLGPKKLRLNTTDKNMSSDNETTGDITHNFTGTITTAPYMNYVNQFKFFGTKKITDW